MPSTRLENTVKRLQSRDGVVGVVIINDEGMPVDSTFDDATTVQYAGLVQQLIDASKSAIKKVDSTNDTMLLRLCTKKYEIAVIPEKQYTMFVVHSSTGSRSQI